MKPGHVLITGGAGFIGSHLAERLLREGRGVTVIDDCSTGSLKNLAAVASHPALRVIESAVSKCSHLASLCAEAEFVFHLAAAVGVELVVHSPIRTIETNLEETEAMLKAAAEVGAAVLITSTSEVYGKSSKTPFSEDDDLLIGPPYLGRWSYACSKLMDEFLALAYFHERKLPVIVARLFNTVGPRQTGQYGMVLPRFVAAALQGEPLRVHGTGDQTRCFCHVADTVEALLRLKDSTAARGQIFNVGGSDEITIRALAERVIRLTGSSSPIELIPYGEAYRPGFEDMQRRKPLVEKLKRVTGFAPGIGLDDIILSTVEFQRARLAGA